jgi:hypothetical protein
MWGASLKKAETWAWDTYRPQQSLMSSTFCSCESSQVDCLQCRSALSFLGKDCPQTHKHPIYVLSSRRKGSILPVALITLTRLLNPSNKECTVDILLSMQCFFRWSLIHLSSNLICTCFSHWRQLRPKGENEKRSWTHWSGKTAGGRSSRVTPTPSGLRVTGLAFCLALHGSMTMVTYCWWWKVMLCVDYSNKQLWKTGAWFAVLNPTELIRNSRSTILNLRRRNHY